MDENKQGMLVIGAFVVLGALVMGGIYMADKGGVSSNDQPEVAVPTPPTPLPANPIQEKTVPSTLSLADAIQPGFLNCPWTISPDELKSCDRESKEEKTTLKDVRSFKSILFSKENEDNQSIEVHGVSYVFYQGKLSAVNIDGMGKTSSDDFPYYPYALEGVFKKHKKMKKIGTCSGKNNQKCKLSIFQDDEDLSKAIDSFSKGEVLKMYWMSDDEHIIASLTPASKIMKNGKPRPDVDVNININYIRPSTGLVEYMGGNK
jgi:hypothetical protein